KTIRLLTVAPLLLLPLLVVFPLLSLAEPAEEQAAQLNILNSDSNSMTIELIVPGFDSRSVQNNGVWTLDISSPGLQKTGLPGNPELPSFSRMIALPPGAATQVTILEKESSIVELGAPVLPAPSLADVDSDRVIGERVFDQYIYQSDEYLPQALVTIGESGYFRDQRVARLEIHPFRINPARNRLEHTSRLLVKIEFTGLRANSGSQIVSSPEVNKLIWATLLNGEEAIEWKSLPFDFRVPEQSLESGIPVFKIEVNSDGIYQVTYDDLLTAGLNVTNTNPISFSLTSQGQAVAIELVGDGDFDFEPGEGFTFYGEQFHGTVREDIYTGVNVYWLQTGGEPGPRISAIDSTPNGAPAADSYRQLVHREENEIWHPVRTIDLGDLDTWYWDVDDTESSGIPVTNTQAVDLSALAPGDYNVSVRAELFSECTYKCVNEKHHAQVYLNGVLVDEQGQDSSWYNIQQRVFSGEISQSDIISGENVFSWVLRSDVVGHSTRDVFLNWFEVEYQRIFSALDNALVFGGDNAGEWTYTITHLYTDTVDVWEITDPNNPIRQLGINIEGTGPYTAALSVDHEQGATFIAFGGDRIDKPLSISRYVPPDLDLSGGADWIAISHPDFITESQRLADHRASMGLVTGVVDVNDVYNLYGYGIYQPAAIHDYLAHTLTWSEHPPAYVLLVGDGNWNFYQSPNYNNKEIFIPPFMGFLDPYQGEVPADNQYVTLVGDDYIPDMALGRLPAGSQAEMTLMVDKIIQHDTQLVDPELWQFTVAFMADNAESGNDFPSNSDSAAAILPDYFDPFKVYFKQTPYTDPAVTKQAFKDAFNNGATLINYRGHGSVSNWADENLFHVSSIPDLTNQDRLPVVISMDCLDTYFAHPNLKSLAVELVRYNNGGAVGHWGSSGLGVSIDHNILNNALYQHLFYDDITQLGMAVVAAKIDFSSQGFEQHNLQTFTLMGDPAMQVVAAELELEKTTLSSGLLFPGDPITFRIDFENHGLYWAYDSTLFDWIPSQIVSPEFQWQNLDGNLQSIDPYSWIVESVIPGEGGVLTVTGWIDPLLDASSGILFTNTAQIETPVMDMDPDNNQDSSQVYVVQPALTVSITAPETITGTGFLSYTFWITNQGSATAENGYLLESLPINTQFSSASGDYIQAGGIVTWSLPELSIGESISRQLVLRSTKWYSDVLVNNDYGVWADHAARVSGKPVSTTVIQVYEPILRISKTAPLQIVGNGYLTYALWITNQGSIAAEDVGFADTVPQDFDFVSASGDYVFNDGVVTWTLPMLEIGETISQQLVLKSSWWYSDVVVNNNYGVWADHVPCGSGQPVSTTVIKVYEPILTISKTAPSFIKGGRFITYTIWISNQGTIDAEAVVLTDAYPQALDFYSASMDYELDGNTITWTVPMLGVSETISRQLVLEYDVWFNGEIVNQEYRTSADHVLWVYGEAVSTFIESDLYMIFLPVVNRN
ncbi:MAG: hypothetical protein JXA42_07490, partial [Anaerolineales bacterium]|nr:hypothetical protein [Anaerolineales bacterium]